MPCSLKPRTWNRPGSLRPWITWCTARGYPWKANTTSRSAVKSPSNWLSVKPCGWSSSGSSAIRSTTLTNRTFRSGTCSRSSSAAASASWVGTSPAHASTMSGRSLSGHELGPLPDAGAGRVVAVRLVEGEVLQVRLLVDHDQVDVVGAAQAVVHDRQRRVGVRRQPDPHHARRQRQHRVDQARALVREPVVVVAPARRGEQHVQRRHRRPPRQLLRVLQPLHVLHRHRRRDHRERLVRREHAVPARSACTPPASPGTGAR